MYLASHTKYYGKYISYRPNCKVSVWVFCGLGFDKWPFFCFFQEKNTYEGWQFFKFNLYIMYQWFKDPAGLHISDPLVLSSLSLFEEKTAFFGRVFSNFGYNCASGLRREPCKGDQWPRREKCLKCNKNYLPKPHQD